MKRQWGWTGLTAVLAAMGLLLAPTTSRADGWAGWPGYGGMGYGGMGYGGMGSYSSGFYGNGTNWGYPYYSNYGWTTPNYNYGNRSLSNRSGYSSSYLGSYPYYTNYSERPVTDSYRSYYPSGTAVSGSDTRPDAHVRVEVPANAEVWFGNFKTTQTGTDRLYVSPPLDAKRNYSYTIRARWTQSDGKIVDQTRSVPVQTGDMVTVNFFQTEHQSRQTTKPAAPPSESVANPARAPRNETPTSIRP